MYWRHKFWQFQIQTPNTGMLMMVFREAEHLKLGVQLQAYTHIPFSSRRENWKLVWALGVKIPVCKGTYRTLCTAHPSPGLCRIRSASSPWINFTFCTSTLCLLRGHATNQDVKCRARNLDGNSTHPLLFVLLLLVVLCRVTFFTTTWSHLVLTLVKHFGALP